jgi:LmbE family N-acetylglucosaminyl deacetylase/glycosyltransferase involved in cell wall biosynthesis
MTSTDNHNGFHFSRQCRPGRTLVLAAHPDDEVLGCGGAIIKHCRQGDPLFIVIITDGGFAVNPKQQIPGYALLRKRESMEAATRMGCGVPRFLDFPDQGLNNDQNLRDRLLALFTEYQPENIYLPAITEIHPDHHALSLAATESVKQYSGECTLYYYEIGAPCQANFYLDITHEAELKNQAINCFISQLEVQNLKEQINGLNHYRSYYLPPDVKSAEAFFRIEKQLLLTLNIREKNAGHILADCHKDYSDKEAYPLISVIVRTVNRPQLPEALDSIARQTFPNLEVILVDAKGDLNLSTISIPENIRLRLINRNKSLSRPEAANAGLEAVEGDFFCFLDEDDLIGPTHIADLWDCLHYRDEMAVYSGIRLIDENGLEQHIFDEPFCQQRLFSENYIPIHAVLYKRKILELGCRFDESLKLFEDWDFLLHVTQFGKLFHLNRVSGTYRNYRSSEIHGNQETAMEYKSRVLSKWSASNSSSISKNPLANYFYANKKNIIHKWPHYFEIYHQYFQRFTDTECVIVEIGVARGGSLKMWQSYFGKRARIIGVDINPECKKFEEPGIEIFIGSQSDRGFLKQLASRLGHIDILIDDGGHRMEEQITSFETLFPYIAENGVYLCEDTHTSYFESYGGGLGKPGTFLEYTKKLLDQLHAWHVPADDFSANEYTRNIHSISFFDSVVVIEKRSRIQPWSEMHGAGLPTGREVITPLSVAIFRTKLKLLGAGLPDYFDVGGLMSHPVHLRDYLGPLYEGTEWPETAETMIGWKRLTQLEQCVTDVLDKNIPGDFIETGVWRGGACILMRYLLNLREGNDRTVWVADSFRGLPAPDKEHFPQDAESDLHQYPILAVTEEEVWLNFRKYIPPGPGVKFLKGMFKETMPIAPIQKLAILRLDGDMYESTIDVLRFLYPKLVVGGYCIIDDYGAIAACRQAVEDYRKASGIEEELIHIDYTGVYWQKREELLA